MAEEPPHSVEGVPTLALSAPERQVLKALQARSGPVEEEELARALGASADATRGSLQRLKSKHLAVVDEEVASLPALTALGDAAGKAGLPERRMLTRLASGPADASALEAAGLHGEECSAAIGILRRLGFLADGIPFRLRSEAPSAGTELPGEGTLGRLARGEPVEMDASFDALKKRGLAQVEHRSTKRWLASEEGRRVALPDDAAAALGALTPAVLASGDWKTASFRPYDVRSAVPRVRAPRPHPYVSWVEEFEEILVGLGFEQSEGPLLETEFWNCDVLFMPQDHPARSIHDVLTVTGVTGSLPDPDLLARVAAVHEGRALPGAAHPITPGWGSPFDPEISKRPILRSQTTSVSARFLARHPTPPFRMYCIDRNFRYESLDARHHLEFGQCEGILGEAGVTIRELVGVFRELALAIGIRDLKFRPSYYPFTEPSFDGYVRHPQLGWMEVFPGGLFRPEVLQPLGIDVPVAAWGIGITRLAMVALGVNDIRDLFLDDLDRLGRGSV